MDPNRLEAASTGSLWKLKRCLLSRALLGCPQQARRLEDQGTSNSFAAIDSSGMVRVCSCFLAGTNLHADRHLFGKVVDLSSSKTSFAAICLRDDGYKGIAWWGRK